MTLTNRITEQISAHVLRGEALPFRLTLADISKHYGVSLMPTRQAVEQLINKKYLIKRPNGRLIVNPEKLGSKPTTQLSNAQIDFDKNSLQQTLIEQIVRMSLLGDAGYIREEATSKQHGVGRTAVRQIFSQLAGRGMLEHVPRCGWRIHPYQEEDVQSYLNIRELFELKALELARKTLSMKELKTFLQNNQPRRGNQPAKLDNRLHAYWIERCGNRFIQEFFERHGPYFSALFDYAAVQSEDIQSEMALQHREILAWIIDGKISKAKKILSDHIQCQQDRLTKTIQQLRNNK